MIQRRITHFFGTKNNASETNTVDECAERKHKEREADKCSVLLSHSQHNIEPHEDGGHACNHRRAKAHDKV
jgi:hypothetical protein